MAMENAVKIEVLIGKSPISGPCSIAMFDYYVGLALRIWKKTLIQLEYEHLKLNQCLNPGAVRI